MTGPSRSGLASTREAASDAARRAARRPLIRRRGTRVSRIEPPLEVEHLVGAKPDLGGLGAPGYLQPGAEPLLEDDPEPAAPRGPPHVGGDLVPLPEDLPGAQEQVRVDPDAVGTFQRP